MKRINRFKQFAEVGHYMAIVLCVTLFLASCDKKKNEEPEPEPNVVAVSIAAIQGVTKPVAGAAPITTIIETEQYTGVVTWTPAVSGTFAAETDYTATITLTAKSGYTFNGVETNFFIVDGATTVSNAANSGNVTAKFSVNVEANGITWEITKDGTLIISGTGAMPDYSGIHHPRPPKPQPWLSIGNSITAVVINDGVTSIGGSAFSGCISLMEVTIPNSVTSIGNHAFSYCSSLSEIIIPNSVESIGSLAFGSCSSLSEITIPNSVESIEVGAFEGCSSLTSVTIPSSVASIGSPVFYGCSGLTSIYVEESNPVYTSEDGILFNKSKTELITYPAGKLDLNYTIPNTVTSIGSCAFSSCIGLSKVTIPNSMTTIGYSAFYACSSLTEIFIPNTIETIEDYAFHGCGNLTEVTIPNSVISMGDYTFYGCTGLTSVTIGSSVTSIGHSAFLGCAGLTSLSSITIPASVTTIGPSAFSYSGLTSVIIPSSVTTIKHFAFAWCYDLTSVTIPSSVTSFENFVFCDCHGLTEVVNESVMPQTISEFAFANLNPYGLCSSACTLRVPKESIDAYRVAEGWKDFGNIVAIE